MQIYRSSSDSATFYLFVGESENGEVYFGKEKRISTAASIILVIDNNEQQ